MKVMVMFAALAFLLCDAGLSSAQAPEKPATELDAPATDAEMAPVPRHKPHTWKGGGYRYRRPTEAKAIHLSDLQLAVSRDAKEKDSYSVALTRADKVIYSGTSRMAVPEGRIVNDIPRKGCRSMIVDLFSGGARCSTTTLLCIDCDGKTTADAFDLADGGAFKFFDANGDGVSELEINHWMSIAYPGVVGGAGQARGAPVGMSRVMVLDGGRWRADRPGEFRNFYLGLSGEARNEARRDAAKGPPKKEQGKKQPGPEPAALHLIQAAYYSVMAGNSEEESRQILQMGLPSPWQPQVEKLFADVRRAALVFNPVTRLE